METDEIRTNIHEQNQRLAIVEMLAPHFGKDVDQLVRAATSVQEYLLGTRRSQPSNTGGTA